LFRSKDQILTLTPGGFQNISTDHHKLFQFGSPKTGENVMSISKYESEIVDVKDKQSTDTDSQKSPSLVVHNDDVNTFENVIITLIEVCGHSYATS
jgi:hypothetical protein